MNIEMYSVLYEHKTVFVYYIVQQYIVYFMNCIV